MGGKREGWFKEGRLVPSFVFRASFFSLKEGGIFLFGGAFCPLGDGPVHVHQRSPAADGPFAGRHPQGRRHPFSLIESEHQVSE